MDRPKQPMARFQAFGKQINFTADRMQLGPDFYVAQDALWVVLHEMGLVDGRTKLQSAWGLGKARGASRSLELYAQYGLVVEGDGLVIITSLRAAAKGYSRAVLAAWQAQQQPQQ